MKATPIEKLEVSAYKIPTNQPESDGTIKWDSTTIVIVEATADGKKSLGYSYADGVTAKLIESKLKDVVVGRDALSPNGAFVAMVKSIRNLGRPGICSMAISAVDTSLWDLQARLLGLPLVTLFGQVREAMPIYGSGGFTSYTRKKLREQLGGWVEQGIPRVKMKIGREPVSDPDRVAAAREAIGDEAELLSMRMALTRANRRSNFVMSLPEWMSVGSRNQSRPTISRGCISCATRARRE